jgi:methionyl-tRNA formyltransferase
MRIVFMGTSAFAVPILAALHSNHTIVAVVTQPDRPSGRGQHMHESPVKKRAVGFGLNIHQPERVRAEDFVHTMQSLLPLDTIVVAAFGQIIPKSILDMPQLGCVNVHASLLPKYRGAAPIQHAVMNGETVTGITTMLMDPGLDTGPILLQRDVSILEDETAGELEVRLSDTGAHLLLQTLTGLQDGSVKPIAQDNAQATLAPSLKREQALVDWNLPAKNIVNRIRAFTPRPGAYAEVGGRMLKIWRASAVEIDGATPGQPVRISGEGLIVAASVGGVLLTEVQPENRKRMSGAEFARGARLVMGDNT